MSFTPLRFKFPHFNRDPEQNHRNIGKAHTDFLESLEDPNCLTPHVIDDWTPTLTFATAGDLTVAYTTRLGWYVRSGNWVRVEFVIVTSTFTHTTASGNLRITGLPFTPKNDSGMVWFGPLNWQGITKANYTQMNAAAAANVAFLSVTGSGSGQNTDNIDTGDMPTGGSVILRGSVSYRIA